MRDREQVAGEIVDAFYKVRNVLGYGFLEKVYENALARELRKRGLHTQQQAPIAVYYEGDVVGEYFADLLVENCVLVELKAVEHLAMEHEVQLLNYLKATDVGLGLLVNFGRNPKVKRKVFDKEYQSPSNQRQNRVFRE